MIGNEVPDKAIFQKINQRIQQAGIGSQTRVTVNVNRGEVTVGGSIQYEMQRQNILRAAQRVPGVRRIIDKLQLQEKKRN